MNLISFVNNQVTIEFTQHELHLVNVLIQEGRISYKCESPEGQELEDGVKSVVVIVEEAIEAGQKITRCH